jgi:hypothetical protein
LFIDILSTKDFTTVFGRNIMCPPPTEGWHRSLAKITELANFFIKGTLVHTIKVYKNNFWIRPFFIKLLRNLYFMVKIEHENLEKTEKLMLDFDQLYLYHFLTQRKSKTCFENLMVWTLIQNIKICHIDQFI